jgi:hypothetical protein
MPVKTFRALIADGGQDTIALHTNNGSTGYRIMKFQVIGKEPGQATAEHTVKIYSKPQTAVDGTVNFSDQTLLGVAYFATDQNPANGEGTTIIFDHQVFNQDIYITHIETNGALDANYYLELEKVTLDLNENTVATLKDIRNVTAPV